MHGFAAEISIFILILGIVAVLSVFAEKIRISTPIVLVVAGLIMGFLPLPAVTLNPDIVFFIFLPPLLYRASWFTSLHEFKRWKRAISTLAIGLVIFTTVIVACAAYYLIPGMTWGLAFVLGAIVSPPDAVAASAAMKGLGLPKRVTTILEGESLINDASGLIAYKYAILAVTTGAFVLTTAISQFFILSIVGVGIGLALAYSLSWLHCKIQHNAVVNTVLTLLAPYIAYIMAESFYGSGVLAVVSCGLYLSWKSPTLFANDTRIMTYGVWETLNFIMEGSVFILIGLQLPLIIKDLDGLTLSRLIGFGVIISLVVIVIRIIWVFPSTYLPRLISKHIRNTEAKPSWQMVSIVAWSGMRGVVSLAAALALPITLDNGHPFPHRSTILFITFSVILCTLVIQGLSLPWLIRVLGIQPDNIEHEHKKQARLRVAQAALLHLEENYANHVDETVYKHVRENYEIKIDKLYNRIREENVSILDGKALYDQMAEIRKSLLKLERDLIIDMQKNGDADFEVLRNMEYELDLEERKLSLEN